MYFFLLFYNLLIITKIKPINKIFQSPSLDCFYSGFPIRYTVSTFTINYCIHIRDVRHGQGGNCFLSYKWLKQSKWKWSFTKSPKKLTQIPWTSERLLNVQCTYLGDFLQSSWSNAHAKVQTGERSAYASPAFFSSCSEEAVYARLTSPAINDSILPYGGKFSYA